MRPQAKKTDIGITSNWGCFEQPLFCYSRNNSETDVILSEIWCMRREF